MRKRLAVEALAVRRYSCDTNCDGRYRVPLMGRRNLTGQTLPAGKQATGVLADEPREGYLLTNNQRHL